MRRQRLKTHQLLCAIVISAHLSNVSGAQHVREVNNVATLLTVFTPQSAPLRESVLAQAVLPRNLSTFEGEDVNIQKEVQARTIRCVLHEFHTSDVPEGSPEGQKPFKPFAVETSVSMEGSDLLVFCTMPSSFPRKCSQPACVYVVDIVVGGGRFTIASGTFTQYHLCRDKPISCDKSEDRQNKVYAKSWKYDGSGQVQIHGKNLQHLHDISCEMKAVNGDVHMLQLIDLADDTKSHLSFEVNHSMSQHDITSIDCKSNGMNEDMHPEKYVDQSIQAVFFQGKNIIAPIWKVAWALVLCLLLGWLLPSTNTGLPFLSILSLARLHLFMTVCVLPIIVTHKEWPAEVSLLSHLRGLLLPLLLPLLITAAARLRKGVSGTVGPPNDVGTPASATLVRSCPGPPKEEINSTVFRAHDVCSQQGDEEFASPQHVDEK